MFALENEIAHGKEAVTDRGLYTHLFYRGAESIKNYKMYMEETVRFILMHLIEKEKPFSGVSPEVLKPLIAGIDLTAPQESLEGLLAEIKEIYADHAVSFHLPEYIAHLNCPVVIPAVAAEAIISALNSSLDTWDQSAGGTLMEMKLIDWTCAALNMGPDADGVFTSGGTQSNLMGLLLARDQYAHRVLKRRIKTEGLPPEASKFRIFTSELSHFSIRKNAGILGLGEQSVITVPADAHHRMDVSALKEMIDAEISKGNLPIAIVATAGTTDYGSIDPMKEMAAVAQTYQLWFHVDAAYGCGLMLSSRHHSLLQGIERADSVTVDYHKAFFQPVSSSAFLVRHRKNFHMITHHADYLNPKEMEEDGIPNQVNKSIQTTRRFDALKLWFTLRIMGKEVLGNYMDDLIGLTKEAAKIIEGDESLELLNKPQISTLLFRYNPWKGTGSPVFLNALNNQIRKKLFESGKAVIASTKVKNEVYLKFTMLNPLTTAKDIHYILKLIKDYGNQYTAVN